VPRRRPPIRLAPRLVRQAAFPSVGGALAVGLPGLSLSGNGTVVAPGSTLGTPNPLALPQMDLVNPLTAVDVPWAAYAALDLRTKPANYTFTEPTSGVTVIKLTDANTPATGSQGYGSHYCDGGTMSSLPYQDGSDWWVHVATFRRPNDVYYLCDVKLTGTGANQAYNWRVVPTIGRELAFTFSNVDPHIAYGEFQQTLRISRYNVQTMALANTGFFPWIISGITGSSPWLMQDRFDRKFIVSGSGGNGAFRVWDSTTNAVLNCPITGNEARIEKDGLYASIGRQIWDLTTNTIVTTVATSGHDMAHSASLRMRWAGQDWDQGPRVPWRYIPPNAAWNTSLANAYFGNGDESHSSGAWVQPSVPLNEQYYCTYGDWSTPSWAPRALGWIRLDGAQARLIAHHTNLKYSQYNGSPLPNQVLPNTGAYYSLAWPNPNPSGHVVAYTSCMQTSAAETSVSSQRWDLFLAIMPRTGGL
jgi:hypothetical protein